MLGYLWRVVARFGDGHTGRHAQQPLELEKRKKMCRSFLFVLLFVSWKEMRETQVSIRRTIARYTRNTIRPLFSAHLANGDNVSSVIRAHELHAAMIAIGHQQLSFVTHRVARVRNALPQCSHTHSKEVETVSEGG